jgi:opacity protein-like surface antigen
MRLRLMLVLLIVAVAAPAMAQTPSVEIGVGYSYLRDEEIDESLPLGWYADIAGNISDSIGLVGEVGGNYKTISDDDPDLDLDVKLSVHTAMGGVRLTRRGDGANIYLQVLAGAARGTVKFQGVSESTTDFAVQPGVGIEFRVGDSMRLRIGGDYRKIFSEGEKATQWRATAGLVFRSGQR